MDIVLIIVCKHKQKNKTNHFDGYKIGFFLVIFWICSCFLFYEVSPEDYCLWKDIFQRIGATMEKVRLLVLMSLHEFRSRSILPDDLSLWWGEYSNIDSNI